MQVQILPIAIKFGVRGCGSGLIISIGAHGAQAIGSKVLTATRLLVTGAGLPR